MPGIVIVMIASTLVLGISLATNPAPAPPAYKPMAVRLDLTELRDIWSTLRGEVDRQVEGRAEISDSMSMVTDGSQRSIRLVEDGEWIAPESFAAKHAASLTYRLDAGDASLSMMIGPTSRFVLASGDPAAGARLIDAARRALRPVETWWGTDASRWLLLGVAWIAMLGTAITAWVARWMHGVGFAACIASAFALGLPISLGISVALEWLLPGFRLSLA